MTAAITLHQPWASLVAEGVKTIETRSWPAPASLIGQPLLIHAGAKRPRTWWGHIDQTPPPWIDPVAMGSCWERFENVNDYTQVAYRWCGPLGAIVASCRVKACVPMVDWGYFGEAPYLRLNLGDGPKLMLRHADVADGQMWPTDLSDQLPYGDYCPGRWAWLLSDVEPTTRRCPACWGRGYVDGICDCPTCDGAGHCPSIPAKGRQRVWRWQP